MEVYGANQPLYTNIANCMPCSHKENSKMAKIIAWSQTQVNFLATRDAISAINIHKMLTKVTIHKLLIKVIFYKLC